MKIKLKIKNQNQDADAPIITTLPPPMKDTRIDMMITGTLLIVLYCIISLLANKASGGSTDKKVISSLDELPFDENGHLTTHIFAYPAGKCASLVNDATDIKNGDFGHQWAELDGEAFTSVFGHLADDQGIIASDENKITNFNSDCVAVCLEKGTLRTVVARPLPHRYFNHGKVDQDGDGGRVDEMTVDRFFMSDSCAKVSSLPFLPSSLFAVQHILTTNYFLFRRLNMDLSTITITPSPCTGSITRVKRYSIKS